MAEMLRVLLDCIAASIPKFSLFPLTIRCCFEEYLMDVSTYKIAKKFHRLTHLLGNIVALTTHFCRKEKRIVEKPYILQVGGAYLN